MAAPGVAELGRLVVKVGSALLVDREGRFRRERVSMLAAEIAAFRGDGRQVLVVSSGAVAIGLGLLGLSRRRARLDDLQAAAAAGQVHLVQAWQEGLAEHGVLAAQVLLTPDDTEHRRRFQNARATLEKLLELGVVPVINENDTVATDELRYGDNDRLAARVAQLVMADGLILLSDVDGLYRSDPHRDPEAEHLPLVSRVTDEIRAMAGSAGSAVGSGGMRSKVLAAGIATHAGCATFVASGTVDRPLTSLAGGARCTVFLAEGTPAAARKQWLAGMLEVRGELRIDAGAARALARGGSLLPVGVLGVDGDFGRGDAVRIVDADGGELGRGLAHYSDEEMRIIRGCRSEEIESRLGYRGRSVVVHRDDLVLFGQGAQGKSP